MMVHIATEIDVSADDIANALLLEKDGYKKALEFIQEFEAYVNSVDFLEMIYSWAKEELHTEMMSQRMDE